ncbi:MAG: SirB2 family protein, partial [Pseudomonadales bacterium]|nr:SirB2 family protein [Pseudomonadales bacterium]
MLKHMHVALAYLTVAGFLLRAWWAFVDAPARRLKIVRIAPHVVDTLLLLLGVTMALQYGLSPVSGWLGAKLAGLVAYVGFGVLTLRATTMRARMVGLTGALASVGYIFAVAFTRDPWPLGSE